jgi:CelD/BcsL family acetyltransferase involved in cellulose biosynthesis
VTSSKIEKVREGNMAKYDLACEAEAPKKKMGAKMMMLKNMINKRKNKGKKASKYATALA